MTDYLLQRVKSLAALVAGGGAASAFEFLWPETWQAPPGMVPAIVAVCGWLAVYWSPKNAEHK